MKNKGVANAAAAAANFNHTSPNADKLVLDYKNHPAYVLFISSLRANLTKIKYDRCLQKYLKHHCNNNVASLSDILSKDPKVIEGEIIQQLMEKKGENFSFSTLSVHIAALYHFFSLNDITLNRKKLSTFVGEQENKYEYRGYTMMKYPSFYLCVMGEERLLSFSWHQQEWELGFKAAYRLNGVCLGYTNVK